MYTNIPSSRSSSSSDKTLRTFNQQSSIVTQLDPAVLTMMTGFLESRNFSQETAELISIAILKQAKQDGYNPMQILETIKGIKQTELSGIVAEILNYNRFKTSSLGVVSEVEPVNFVKRNIVV
jgi:hypothetical protein